MQPTQPFALIIEDDPSLGKILHMCLDAAGYDAEVIADGEYAVERLHFMHPTLITLDLNLPSLNGMEILKFIRSDERLANTWVMLNTANAVQADAFNQIDDPYLFIVIKPFSTAQIIQIAQRLRANAEMQQAM